MDIQPKSVKPKVKYSNTLEVFPRTTLNQNMNSMKATAINNDDAENTEPIKFVQQPNEEKIKPFSQERKTFNNS